MIQFAKKECTMIIIVGTGKMAEAIIAGLTQKGEKIIVVGRDEKKLHQLSSSYPILTAPLQNFSIAKSNAILAVKPHALKDVAQQLRGKANTIFSILAGTTIKELHTIPANYYIRAMPNIAAAKGASTTAITGDVQAKEMALQIFETIGKAIWVESEKELDIATAIAGSGPAFLALVAEAMIDGGVVCGMKREIAKEFVNGLFESFAALTDNDPAQIKNMVMSPAGTTAEGIRILEKRALRALFIEAVNAAFQKTQKI